MQLLNSVKALIEKNINENVVKGSLLDSDCVGLFLTQGQPPTMYFDKSILERKGLQIRVRNKSYENGYETIRNIFSILNNQVGFNPSQSPFYCGRNEKGFAEFSVNYIVMVE